MISFKRYNKWIKRDIFCFDFRSNFLVSSSFLINIGKEMSLPGFRMYVLLSLLVSKANKGSDLELTRSNSTPLLDVRFDCVNS